MPGEDDARTDPRRVIFRPTTFLLAGTILLALGVGLTFLGVLAPGESERSFGGSRIHSAIRAAAMMLYLPAGFLFFASAYLWVHREE